MKNIRNFVWVSSIVLACWLGLTFVSEVPSHRYPTLGRGIPAASASHPAVSGEALTAAVEQTPEDHLPVAR